MLSGVLQNDLNVQDGLLSTFAKHLKAEYMSTQPDQYGITPFVQIRLSIMVSRVGKAPDGSA